MLISKIQYSPKYNIAENPENFTSISLLEQLDSQYVKPRVTVGTIFNVSNIRTTLLTERLVAEKSRLPEGIYLEDVFNEGHLQLSGEMLTPESINQIIHYITTVREKTIESISLRLNNLTSLPEGIVGLTSLEYLYLNCNNLTSLPESICALPSLKNLDIHRNNITSLPNNIGDLSMLTSLDIRDNNITSLPESFSRLIKLEYLYYNTKLDNESELLVSTLKETVKQRNSELFINC
jgi:internalin A